MDVDIPRLLAVMAAILIGFAFLSLASGKHTIAGVNFLIASLVLYYREQLI